VQNKPHAELLIDVPLVRRLLEQQVPELASLPLARLDEGWDNQLFRLGASHVVRLPRRAASAVLVEREQRWLPELAPRLPLPVPVPIYVGRPGSGYPWAWSVVRWLYGDPALTAPLDDAASAASTLQRFLTALHQPAPADAPFNQFRSVPLPQRLPLLQEHLAAVGGLVDRRAIERDWQRAAAVPWRGPAVWIHGDLHPGNILAGADGICAVIDFGDLAAGDPATDWAAAWMLPGVADIVEASLDPDTRLRARGWALSLGLAFAAHSRGDGDMKRVGLATIERALTGAG
jgi:aminoglycoside phosphotransferase (APT) family kinase protein